MLFSIGIIKKIHKRNCKPNLNKKITIFAKAIEMDVHIC